MTARCRGIIAPIWRINTELVSRNCDKLVVEVGVANDARNVQQWLAPTEYEFSPMDAGEACVVQGAKEVVLPPLCSVYEASRKHYSSDDSRSTGS
jgi:hypothetical protein